MTAKLYFDPQRVAHLEAAGWRAYYDRRWLKMLQLMIAICQEQFHIPFPGSWLAAYYTIRASVAWIPQEHDLQKVLMYLEKFYRLVQRSTGLSFDPTQVARLELRYFAVHRRLAGTEDKHEFVEALIELHHALSGLTREQVRASAELRVQAADTVDRITSKQSTSIENDWAALEEYLCQCYTSIQHELAKPPA